MTPAETVYAVLAASDLGVPVLLMDLAPAARVEALARSFETLSAAHVQGTIRQTVWTSGSLAIWSAARQCGVYDALVARLQRGIRA